MGLIQNDATFRKMWDSAMTVQQIADALGVRQCISVTRAGQRFGLPQRRRRTAQSARAVPGAGPDELPPCPELAATGFWTPHHDRRVWKAQGRYADLNDLADEWGVPSTRVTARWHLLRAAR